MPLATVDSYWAILAGTLALILAAVTMLRRHQFRTTSLRDMAREQLARLRDQREVQAALDDLLVQLEEVSRRVAAQVETRYAKLECVIRDADQRIARLEALSRAAPPGPPPAAEPAFQPGLAAAAVAPPVAPAAPGAPAAPRSERFRRIYEMADAGTSALAIADALQIPLGEVELILGLRRLKK